jgi:hypothetical protein
MFCVQAGGATTSASIGTRTADFDMGDDQGEKDTQFDAAP